MIMSGRNTHGGRLAALVGVALLLTACAELMPVLTNDPAAGSTPSDGLREALRVGTGRAVDALGRADGYLANPDVRIPVPPKLETIAKGLKTIGAGALVEEFVTSMNRAAEAAAPVAKQVFVDSIREMTFGDAMAILRGQSHEATDFLELHGRPRLHELFRPIVADKLAAVGATRSFEELMGETEKIPFMSRPAFELEPYVTDVALDGLFLMLAREEERIRKDPLARTTALLKKYFGS